MANHLDRLRLRHLRLLSLIDQHRSLREVAATIHLTQPAVSQMLKDLESTLGADLVERSANGVKLSPAGRMALQRASAGLATFDQLVKDIKNDVPTLRVGCNPSLMYSLIPLSLHDMGFSDAHLNLRIVAGTESTMINALSTSEIDAYVGVIDWQNIARDQIPRFVHMPVRQGGLAIVCGRDHPLVGAQKLHAQDLLAWPWVLNYVGSGNRAILEGAFLRAGLTPPQPRIELSADPYAMLTLAAEVPMLACLPRTVLQGPPPNARWVELEVADLTLRPLLAELLYLKESEHFAPLSAFRQALMKHLQAEEGQ